MTKFRLLSLIIIIAFALLCGCTSNSNGNSDFNKGLAYAQLERYDEAIDSFNKAIEKEPNNSLIYVEKGKVLFKQDRIDKAEIALDRAIEINSSDYIAYSAKGLLYEAELEKGYSSDYDQMKNQSIGMYSKAIEINPIYNDALLFKARVLLKAQFSHPYPSEVLESLNFTERLLKEDPENIETLAIKVKALEEVDYYRFAKDYDLTLLPNGENAFYQSVCNRHVDGELENVTRQYHRSGSDLQNNTIIMAHYSAQYQSPEYALKNINSALKEYPNDAGLLEIQGDTYFKLKRFSDSIESYNQVLKNDPKNVVILSKLAKTYNETDNNVDYKSTMKKIEDTINSL